MYAGRPDHRAVQDHEHMLDEGIAVVDGLEDGGIVGRPDGQSVWPRHTAPEQDLDGVGDPARVVLEVLHPRHLRMRRGLRDADDAHGPPTGESAAPSVEPRLVAEYVQPCGPSKSTTRRAPSGTPSRSRASESMSFQPRSEIGARRSRWSMLTIRVPSDFRFRAKGRLPRPPAAPSSLLPRWPRPPRAGRCARCRRPGTGCRGRCRARSASCGGGTRGPCRSA